MRNLLIFFLSLLFSGLARAQVPPAPDPPRLVNDFAGLLSSGEVSRLEKELVDFNNATSNVICIVTVDDLGGYPASQFAYEIGEQWGVRDAKDYRNGIVILLKPRNRTPGEVYIAVGYDLEGALPDATVKKIVEYEMIPELKKEAYYQAIDRAVKIIQPVIAGEISYERENSNLDAEEITEIVIAIFLLFLCLLFIFRSKNKKGGKHRNNSSGRMIWFPPSTFGGGGGSSSSRGGFGGFGGRGGFGGGGAGGRF